MPKLSNFPIHGVGESSDSLPNHLRRRSFYLNTFMTTMHPSQFSVELRPHQVEYRLPTGYGVRVVRVVFTTIEPRIMAWSEKPAHPVGIEVNPMSLSMSEVELFVQDAHVRLAL